MPWIGDKEVTHEEYNAWSWQQSEERRRAFSAEFRSKIAERQEAERLIRKLGAAYTEYQQYLEARPHVRHEATGGLSEEQALYQQLRRNLGHADDAPRCSHIKADGLRCRSPRMKAGRLCYAHQRIAHATSISMPLNYEDPNSIQLGLMEVSRALVDQKISGKDAGLLLYALQIASSNVDRVTFHQAPKEIVLEAPADELRQFSPPEIPDEPIDEAPKLLAIGDAPDHRDCESTPQVEVVSESELVLCPAAVVLDPAHTVEGEPTYPDSP